ncbi:MAG: hypothetical protein KatS3mg068_1930 [Candidatus Sericytochromatia bacterium]|nr:MAG: hypothetical protein KatS3mg068_1930 [Candidatus Sericytochromatia bacterium]
MSSNLLKTYIFLIFYTILTINYALFIIKIGIEIILNENSFSINLNS